MQLLQDKGDPEQFAQKGMDGLRILGHQNWSTEQRWVLLTMCRAF